jgi:hypothetical protein
LLAGSRLDRLVPPSVSVLDRVDERQPGRETSKPF